jgi:hypothetical protein
MDESRFHKAGKDMKKYTGKNDTSNVMRELRSRCNQSDRVKNQKIAEWTHPREIHFSLFTFHFSLQKFDSHLSSGYIAAKLITLAVVMMAITGCKDSGISSGDDIVFPAKNISYMTSIQPLFNLRCSYYGCHDDQTRAGSLSLTSYVNLTSIPGMVIPKDTLNSLLLQEVQGKIMHQQPILINQNQINGIKQWIIEGAKYN